jgi:hypothetical protein
MPMERQGYVDRCVLFAHDVSSLVLEHTRVSICRKVNLGIKKQ